MIALIPIDGYIYRWWVFCGFGKPELSDSVVDFCLAMRIGGYRLPENRIGTNFA